MFLEPKEILKILIHNSCSEIYGKKFLNVNFTVTEISQKVKQDKFKNFDFQTNLCLILSKELKKSPKEIYDDIYKKLNIDSMCYELSEKNFSSGFIVFCVKETFLNDQLNQLYKVLDK
jgi:arginyl-tRNA synthetase